MAFQTEAVTHYAAVYMQTHSSSRSDGFVFFYLVERLLSKGAHYMESLFYCVQQINKWEAQEEKIDMKMCTLHY